jgi:hypothetical protein
MKKGLLFLLAIFSMGMARAQVEVTDVSGMDYVIYAEEVVASPNSVITLPIYMKNELPCQAFQIYFSFPEGVSIAEAQGEYAKQRYDSGSTVFEIKPQSDGSYGVIGTILSNKGFLAGDGLLGTIKISVGDLAIGEYPITILADDAHNSKIAGTIIGYSGDATINGEDQSFSEPIVSKLIINDRVNLYETATAAPKRQSGVDVLVTRTIKAGEWSTICLPFAMTGDQVAEAFGEDVKFADYVGYEPTENDGIIEQIDVQFESYDAIEDGLEQHHPYLIKVSKDIKQFTADGVNIATKATPANGEFIGTYVTKDIDETSVFLSGNKFWYSTGATTIKGFRGYFLFDDVLEAFYDEAGVKFNMTIDGATKITSIDNEKSNDVIYNINGIKMGNDMNRLNKGIYIVNGKKIVK